MLFGAALALAQTQPQKTAAAGDYSGMYSFLQEGEFVQISVDEGKRVTGFISRYSDTNHASFTDYFFDKADLHDGDLRFSTRKVQGTWFDFQGAISRGPGKSRDAEAYYLIKGTLTQHATDARQAVTASKSEVVLRSFPQEIEDESEDKAPGTRR